MQFSYCQMIRPVAVADGLTINTEVKNITVQQYR